MFAVAPASLMARLMPIPRIGDIACAASPIQSSHREKENEAGAAAIGFAFEFG